MYNGLYDIDYNKLITWLTPIRIRKVKLLRFQRIVISGVVTLYQDFLRYRKQKLYELMITPQVCYLERLLNDRWDYTARRIRIGEAEWHTPVYIFQEAELKPVHLFTEGENSPIYLYGDGEAGDVKDDFIVLVPFDIKFDESEMRSLLNIFKLAGKRYKIQRV